METPTGIPKRNVVDAYSEAVTSNVEDIKNFNSWYNDKINSKKASSKSKVTNNPYGHQELLPNTQRLQTNATTPMQLHNATQRAGDNVTSSSSTGRSRSGYRHRDDAREQAGATWRDSGDTAWRHSGQQGEATAEREDAVDLQELE